MKNTQTFRVGDKIIDHGQAYKIFKIKEGKTGDGEKKKFIYYEPVFTNREENTVTCSIPLKNISKTRIRRPISQEELTNILAQLSQSLDGENKVKITQLMETLLLNDAFKTAQVIKILWLDKEGGLTNFTERKKDVFVQAVRRLSEEVAVVTGDSIVKAKRVIEEALTRD